MDHKIKHGDVFKWQNDGSVYVFLQRAAIGDFVPIVLVSNSPLKHITGTVYYGQSRTAVHLVGIDYIGNISAVLKVLEQHYKDK